MKLYQGKKKKTKLFKKYDYPSWKMDKSGEVARKVYNSATWWPCYINDLKACSQEGTGFQVVEYKIGEGVKSIKINKPAKKKTKVPKKLKKLGFKKEHEEDGFVMFSLSPASLKPKNK